MLAPFGPGIIGATMHAAALRMELRIPGVQSLKAKRRVLRGLLARLDEGFDVSIAEVDHQDDWQRATVGVAVVASEHAHLEQILGVIRQRALEWPGTEVIEFAVAYLEEEA